MRVKGLTLELEEEKKNTRAALELGCSRDAHVAATLEANDAEMLGMRRAMELELEQRLGDMRAGMEFELKRRESEMARTMEQHMRGLNSELEGHRARLAEAAGGGSGDGRGDGRGARDQGGDGRGARGQGGDGGGGGEGGGGGGVGGKDLAWHAQRLEETEEDRDELEGLLEEERVRADKFEARLLALERTTPSAASAAGGTVGGAMGGAVEGAKRDNEYGSSGAPAKLRTEVLANRGVGGGAGGDAGGGVGGRRGSGGGGGGSPQAWQARPFDFAEAEAGVNGQVDGGGKEGVDAGLGERKGGHVGGGEAVCTASECEAGRREQGNQLRAFERLLGEKQSEILALQFQLEEYAPRGSAETPF